MNNTHIQGSDEWLQLRKSYIGASDSPVILGVAHWKLADGRIKTPYLLWQEKLGLIDLNSKTSATTFGSNLEPIARSAYESMTGNLVAPEVIFHKSIPFLMASLDGLSIDKDLAVEIKCINKSDHELARQGIIPPQYKPQVYHQLECLGHEMMHYFSYHAGEGIIVEVHRDEEYQSYLKEKLAEFWNCVETFSCPPMSDFDYVEKDSMWEQLAKDLYDLKQVIKNYELQHDLVLEKLIEISNDKSSISGSFKFEKSLRKGIVDYSSIPEIKDMDLESYRKQPTCSWKLSKLNKK